MERKATIGVFDSGYGGLTVLKDLKRLLPQYSYIYLGDNARTPYGTRSFDVVYNYTLEGVKYLFSQGCNIVILACNTASAKALRTIQQVDLPTIAPDRRVLGVIRPSIESISETTSSNSIGILATIGTVNSDSYRLELEKFFPDVKISQQACPMWVPIVENGEVESEGSYLFIKRDIELLLAKDPNIDTILLGCTHYPMMQHIVESIVPSHIRVVAQGSIVADSFVDYLKRHPELENNIRLGGDITFLTTEDPSLFQKRASCFWSIEESIKRVTF